MYTALGRTEKQYLYDGEFCIEEKKNYVFVTKILYNRFALGFFIEDPLKYIYFDPYKRMCGNIQAWRYTNSMRN